MTEPEENRAQGSRRPDPPPTDLGRPDPPPTDLGRRSPVEVRLHVPGDLVWTVSRPGVLYAWRIDVDGHPVMADTSQSLDRQRAENAPDNPRMKR